MSTVVETSTLLFVIKHVAVFFSYYNLVFVTLINELQ